MDFATKQFIMDSSSLQSLNASGGVEGLRWRLH